PRAGLVSPEHAVRTQLRLAEEAGTQLQFGTDVRAWSAGPHGVVVRTDGASFQADRLVLCAGAWAPGLLAGHGLRLKVQRQVQHWFDIPAARAAAFAPGNFPIHVWDDRQLFYAMPMIDGPGGGLKCCLELDPPAIDPDRLDRAISAAEIAQVQSVLEARLPGLGGRWLRGAVCMYAASADNRFIIGALPGSPRTIIASGLGGHGFKFTPAIGELVADLVAGQGEDLAARLAPFDPLRRVDGAALCHAAPRPA
ncbi:MAG: FAD-dependent oxidoreductase, partial [Rhodospirillales bacterium]|nr:FAD-dependent oxidoreductase [Rhodospirillales bacterium]